MIGELLLCLFCFGIGGLGRFGYVGVCAVERRVKFKAVTFLLDVIWGIILVGSLMLVILIFNNGITMPYMLIAALLGFAVTAIFI